MTVVVHHGDCREVLATLPAESVDSVVCDPPYHLTSIVKRFGSSDAAPAQVGATGAYARASRGFMGKTWDGGDVAFQPETWAAVLRAMKPGAHLVAFGGTRTYHRMACAIEDAGFEVRDTLAWLYGSGFPKSHNVSKAIDRANGDERERLEPQRRASESTAIHASGFGVDGWAPSSNVAASAAWDGWGTALKPAFEPLILARKPLVGTIAANVLQHGTGALNIDGCRIEATPDDVAIQRRRTGGAMGVDDGRSIYGAGSRAPAGNPLGRWPANVIHDGSDEVLEAFAKFGDAPGQQRRTGSEFKSQRNVYGEYAAVFEHEPRHDSGTAARFFYSSKADSGDRLGSKHPTVKPVDLMRWLVRLVTPPGGLVLDPFAGTGTTGMAALMESMRAVLIEREAEYVADINRRLAHMRGGDAPLFAEPTINKPTPADEAAADDPLALPDFLRRD